MQPRRIDYLELEALQLEQRGSVRDRKVKDWGRSTPRPNGRAEIDPAEMRRHLDAIADDCEAEYADEMTELRADIESFYLERGINLCE
jgi:hypothetical protein